MQCVRSTCQMEWSGKMILEQALEGHKGYNKVNIWEESIPENSPKERVCLEVLVNNKEVLWLQQSP